ncbi:FMRFamide receptor, partial [Elysia marginata]
MARGRVAASGDRNTVGDHDIDYGLDYGGNLSAQDYWLGDPECESQDYLYDDPKAVVMYYIELGVFPALLLQAILGNALIIPALISLGRSAWSTLLYLAVVGFTDLIIMLARCGNMWYLTMTNDNLSTMIVDSSDAACRTYYFAFTFITHINPWLLVAAAIEMTITAKWPKSSHEACTVERARYVIMLLTLIFVCLDINYFWTFGVPNRPGVGC